MLSRGLPCPASALVSFGGWWKYRNPSTKKAKRHYPLHWQYNINVTSAPCIIDLFLQTLLGEHYPPTLIHLNEKTHTLRDVGKVQVKYENAEVLHLQLLYSYIRPVLRGLHRFQFSTFFSCILALHAPPFLIQIAQIRYQNNQCVRTFWGFLRNGKS